MPLLETMKAGNTQTLSLPKLNKNTVSHLSITQLLSPNMRHQLNIDSPLRANQLSKEKFVPFFNERDGLGKLIESDNGGVALGRKGGPPSIIRTSLILEEMKKSKNKPNVNIDNLYDGSTNNTIEKVNQSKISHNDDGAIAAKHYNFSGSKEPCVINQSYFTFNDVKGAKSPVNRLSASKSESKFFPDKKKLKSISNSSKYRTKLNNPKIEPDIPAIGQYNPLYPERKVKNVFFERPSETKRRVPKPTFYNSVEEAEAKKFKETKAMMSPNKQFTREETFVSTTRQAQANIDEGNLKSKLAVIHNPGKHNRSKPMYMVQSTPDVNLSINELDTVGDRKQMIKAMIIDIKTNINKVNR